MALLLGAATARADGFTQITGAVGHVPRATLCARMVHWADAHPDDPRAPQGLIWAAKLRVLDSEPDAARALYLRVERRHPDSRWALEAVKGASDLDLEHHHYASAIRGYTRLANTKDPFWRYTGRMSLAFAEGARTRFFTLMGILGVFVLFWGVWLFRKRLRALWPPPEELLYTLPLWVVLGISAFGQTGRERTAVLILASGAFVLAWLNGAMLRASPPRRLRGLWVALFGLTQAVALFYCAIVASNLWSKLMDTLTMGADR